LIATLFVLAPLIVFLLPFAGMLYSFNANGQVNQEALAGSTISMCFTAIWYSLLLYPVGVLMHWLIAWKTRILSLGARQAIFWSSLLICTSFPVGTIMGGAALWLLIFSPVFQCCRLPAAQPSANGNNLLRA
jgi:Kef-type K+ transport system membrane component KefB